MQAWRGNVMACLAVATVVLTEAEELATYDQRQTGKLNVHLHVKDVSILALLDGGYAQYDYSYDYLDPEEVKPTEQEKPSTEQEKPSTGQEKPPTGQEKPPTEQEKPPTEQEKPPTKQEKPPTEHQKPSTLTDTSPTSTTVLSDLSTTAGPEGSDQKQQQASVGRSRRCKPGYWRDSHGQCRRNRKPNDHTLQKLPFLLRLAAFPGVDISASQKPTATEDRQTPLREK